MSLMTSNPYLKDASDSKIQNMLRKNVESSTAIEGVNISEALNDDADRA